jgi:hypothetical protein
MTFNESVSVFHINGTPHNYSAPLPLWIPDQVGNDGGRERDWISSFAGMTGGEERLDTGFHRYGSGKGAGLYTLTLILSHGGERNFGF